MTNRAPDLCGTPASTGPGIDRLDVPFGSASMEALYGPVTATGLRRLLIDGSIAVDVVAYDSIRKISVGAGQRSSPLQIP